MATDTSKSIIAYALQGKFSRADLVSFDVKLAALYFNQATSSLLGWLSRITLGLGFVLMLSAALLSIEERKREFGIFAAVGVSSDVFYLFFLESLILFVGATAIGLILGAWLLWVLTPALFVWSIILKSSVLVACYLPPMVIFGSLVPAQRLLQKSPLELLRSAA
jgi:ABC-type antimicrobial peptide transport system permease subunit